MDLIRLMGVDTHELRVDIGLGVFASIKRFLTEGANDTTIPYFFIGGWGSTSPVSYEKFATALSRSVMAPVYVFSLPSPAPVIKERMPEWVQKHSQFWKGWIIKEVIKTILSEYHSLGKVHLAGYSEGALNALVACGLLRDEGLLKTVASYSGINPLGLTEKEAYGDIVIRGIYNSISVASYKKKCNLSESIALASHNASIKHWVKSCGGLGEAIVAMDPGRIDMKDVFISLVEDGLPVKLLTYKGDDMIDWEGLVERYSSLAGKIDLRVCDGGHHSKILINPERLVEDLED